MDVYEQKAYKEMLIWQIKMNKKPSFINKSTKTFQNKINHMIPEKVHQVITISTKHIVQVVLSGSEYTTTRFPLQDVCLEEREKVALLKLNRYKKIAAAEGAGTGAGGILLGLADFPLLLSIKMKFLFDIASIYGFNVRDYRERLYILHLFQLAFSSRLKRREVYKIIANWEVRVLDYPEERFLKRMDWRSFQLEYRDHIDLIKMMQMVPGFGAIVGSIANYHFLDVLGEVAMNGYRLRWFEKNEEK